ncbi:hypothetical protein IFM89_030187, partial [Coptis chinensis]
VIPAENIVAAFQDTQKTEFAISKTPSEAQIFFEGYVDRRNEVGNLLSLNTATVTRVQVVGMGDRVCVDLCTGLLVGSFARGLFLVHSECLESNYIASRPFRVKAGPIHAYVAVPGGRTSYLSELQTGKEVLVVDQCGRQRTEIVGQVKIEKRPLILVEAKFILSQRFFVHWWLTGNGSMKMVIPVTSLEVGDEVMLRVQGEARHTGIEIQEFVLEK